MNFSPTRSDGASVIRSVGISENLLGRQFLVSPNASPVCGPGLESSLCEPELIRDRKKYRRNYYPSRDRNIFRLRSCHRIRFLGCQGDSRGLAWSFGITPCPWRHMTPRRYCASAFPCSAFARSSSTDSCCTPTTTVVAVTITAIAQRVDQG